MRSHAIIGEAGSSIPHPAAAGTAVSVVTWLASSLYKIMYVFPPCEPQRVSGPLKTSSSRCSIGLIYQTLEATSRQSQLLPTSGQLWHVCIQKTSLGIQPAFLTHGGRLLSSPSHHGASDELVTSGLTNDFEGPVSAGSSDVEWPWKSSTGRNALFVMTWSMRADRWRRFGRSHRSAAVLARVLDVFLCPLLFGFPFIFRCYGSFPVLLSRGR